ncbi:MAG: ABC-ATPase domain-containing protein, partial [Lachnospiraceae bacterium]|nr:ABC-ATPase domain-containing protein [Lachnospiraceae bacterium]
TVRFSTEDASGSTSQAANLMEALEGGSSLILIDEDTSATNFMVRDQLMACHRDIMATKIRKQGERPLLDIKYPKGYEG